MRTTQSEIRNFCAIDCTNDETPLFDKYLRIVAYSIGIYGINGVVMCDENGNFYKICRRNNLLFKYV